MEQLATPGSILLTAATLSRLLAATLSRLLATAAASCVLATAARVLATATASCLLATAALTRSAAHRAHVVAATRATSIVVITIVHVVFAIVIPIPVSHDPFLPFGNVSLRGHGESGKHRPYHPAREARNGCVRDLRSVS